MSGLRSEYFNPPRLALAELAVNQLRDVPEKQYHFHIPKILFRQRRARTKPLKASRGSGKPAFIDWHSAVAIAHAPVKRVLRDLV